MRFADATMTKMRSVVRLFRDWQAHRSRTAVEKPDLNMSPINVQLEAMTGDELNYAIARFVVEVKKENGDEYPGETLRGMVVMLQLYLETLGREYKFLSDDFMQLRNTVDTIMKERRRKGIGMTTKQAEIITIGEEDMLWEKGVLGDDTPRKLMRTVFYLVGLNFALRAGKEHRDLRYGVENNPQIKLLRDDSGKQFMRYTEHVSKANQGGLKDRQTRQKVVDAYENTTNSERCIVRLFQLYVSHSPENRPSAFYLRPLDRPSGNIWYSSQAVGRQKLQGIVADICKEGGLLGHRTNHSLRATAATRLYSANVDEQLITEVTGHRSMAVRNYKRTSDAQKRSINEIVQGQVKKSKGSSEIDLDSVSTSVASAMVPGANVHVTINVNTKS